MKIALKILLPVVLFAAKIYGQGTLQVDQQAGFLPDPIDYGGAPVGIQANEPIGQSFTPSLAAVGFIELNMGDANPGNSLGATVYVNLRSGSITGTILGSTTPVTMPDSFSGSPVGGGFAYFYFAAPVAITPGTTYYFDIVAQSGSDAWLVAQYNSYGYMGGSEIYQGVAAPNFDLRFEEGVVVPEPSAAWLALASGGLFFCIRRWQKSPPRQT